VGSDETSMSANSSPEGATYLSPGRKSGVEETKDFLAAYIGPMDLWYIVPVHVIQSSAAIVISPGARLKQRGMRFEPYREAWHLLTRKSRRVKQSVIESDTLEPTRERTHLDTAVPPPQS
jgi:hypothetical protein